MSTYDGQGRDYFSGRQSNDFIAPSPVSKIDNILPYSPLDSLFAIRMAEDFAGIDSAPMEKKMARVVSAPQRDIWDPFIFKPNL